MLSRKPGLMGWEFFFLLKKAENLVRKLVLYTDFVSSHMDMLEIFSFIKVLNLINTKAL